MADTIRKQIIDAIAANLAAVKVANGYFSDAGDRVIVGESLGPDFLLPALVISVGEEQAERLHRRDKIAMAVKIMCLLPAPNDDERSGLMDSVTIISEAALGDIRIAMGQALSIVDDVVYVTGSAGVELDPDNGVTASGAVAEYEIRYQTRANDPYQQ